MAKDISDSVLSALSDSISAEDNPGMVNAFVLVYETLREDGSVTMGVAYPDEQTLARSLGLIGYGEEWVRDDLQRSFIAMDFGPDGC